MNCYFPKVKEASLDDRGHEEGRLPLTGLRLQSLPKIKECIKKKCDQ